ncbi:MAG: class I SAM-dependent methyltransferase [Gammaproteobacteria bacterium]|nr:class I SAM-dependent methyltransferase [Gammaproteobacteria bacterium]
MTNKSITLTDALYDYLIHVSVRETPLLTRLREETARDPLAVMQIAPEQGQFMALLVQLMGAKKTLEIGVFTGYSSLCVALALPADGRLVACDVSESWTQVAQRYWQEAGVQHKIDLHLAPARETLDQLLHNGEGGTFDFAFIDADKTSYDAYYERTLQLLRPGGLIMFDNMLWGGSVADPGIQDDDTLAIRHLNEKLLHDKRVALSLLPVADGISLALKCSTA